MIRVIKTFVYFFYIFFPLKKKRILFHGYNGRPSGNSLAVFNYLEQDTFFRGKLFWASAKEDKNLDNGREITIIPLRNSSFFSHVKFLFFLLTFKIIVCESAGDLSFYLRFLPKQIKKILLHHGMPIKSVGINAPHLNEKQKKVWQSMGDKFDIFSVSCELEKNIIRNGLNVPLEKIKIIGSQRKELVRYSDLEMNNSRELINKNFNLNIDQSAKIIFYTPTHRDHSNTLNRPNLFGFKNLEELDNFLVLSNSFLLIREHSVQTLNDFKKNFSNIALERQDIYTDFHLYASCTNFLITDYSGIFLEFLASKMKIGFWQYDINEYRKKRGFCLPESIFNIGTKIENEEDFYGFINNQEKEEIVDRERKFWERELFKLSKEESLRSSKKEIICLL
tara:strand:- start:236 stop:1414 length:1179 start_codon:yes stop_codon:yes gene_type:complete